MGVDCDYPKPCQCGCHFPASEDATARKPAPSYSPVYCALYPELAKVAREHGYALAIHGSLVRDFDLIAVPWVERPAEPAALVEAFTTRFALHRMDEAPMAKPHGRVAYTISVGFGECAIDLSFMPHQPPAPATEGAGVTLWGFAQKNHVGSVRTMVLDDEMFIRAEREQGIALGYLVGAVVRIDLPLDASEPSRPAGWGR